MTPAQFIAKWQHNPLSERAGAQPFFLDLCAMLGVPTPTDPDNYCFERGATRTGAGHGWADVWMRGHFGWENKGPGGDLAGALRQLMTYALALDNPPLLVVSNRALTEIHTHFTGTPSETHTIRLEDIGTPENQQKLRWLFTDPEKFRPGRTVLDITTDAAGRFADIARSMTTRGHDPQKVAHFLIQCLFCMFAEDIGLLPRKLFERVIDKRQGDAGKLAGSVAELFGAMRSGGDFLLEDIAYFNGGLFEHIDVVEMIPAEIDALLKASKMDWSSIEPSILGTLFERGLDPKVRAPLGANYTDPETIMKLVGPVLVEPLEREWNAAKARLAPLIDKYQAGGKGSQKAMQDAQGIFLGYLERLRNFRVLDPACGSGNFLYLSLRALKDLEHRANLDAEALGLHRQLTIETSPDNVLGLEINAYAAELARVTVWIGEIQWMLKHGYDCRRNPILARLDHIENRDALIDYQQGTDWDGIDPITGEEIHGEMGVARNVLWPTCDVIVGNPPFLGDKRMRAELGSAYVDCLRREYKGRVPGGADLVTYWFERAREQIAAGQCQAAGLVATNSIRGGANRKVLDRIAETTRIFEAWSDEPWVNEGAAVRVSLLAFGHVSDAVLPPKLDGVEVEHIHTDLTAGDGLDLTSALRLNDNLDVSFIGPQKNGPFDIPGDQARIWLSRPNPHGESNSLVVRPWANGLDITRRPADRWIVDFGGSMRAEDASLFEEPYNYVVENIKPERVKNNRPARAKYWWRHGEIMPAMRLKLAGLPRFIGTARVAKHRLLVWLNKAVLPDCQVVVIARSDDTTFGILHSRLHELWSLGKCTWMGVGNDPRYTPSTTFETFPFPAGMTPADTAAGAPEGAAAEAIAAAARRLDTLRSNWLNPADWVDWVVTPEEAAAGFPARPVARPGHEAELKKRTLTNLYNQRPAWLANAHQALDQAVAVAYGWSDYSPAMADDEILRRLLKLNLERA
ncbi:DNA methyltransferase yeeA [Zoogloea ramigera]|uniref:site-specific DNA-methyltransferase (adenine-specific) n=1 Tax=Zoogloea ramigera TaxID=350 RepID=A0A4Y4CUP7_ZOORA|nr:DNA methyltransferase [Zoogloea ramigera]GEC94737.1 DNA methyltransferase yeeA [Zoogloea ramigera]